MWKRRIAGIALAISVLFNAGVVNAETVSVDNGTTTQSVASNFSVPENLLGGGLTVSIPPNLDLEYDAETQSFKANENVSISGTIDNGKTLTIQVNETAEYTNKADSTVKAEGVVSFGDSGVVTFSEGEISASEPISIEVPLSNITVAGDYSLEINFSMEME